jgi:hypothetical protein
MVALLAMDRPTLVPINVLVAIATMVALVTMVTELTHADRQGQLLRFFHAFRANNA